MPYVALAHAGRVHYAERGERRPGRPSALLIHGAGASSAIWMMVLARVARVGHAIAIDLPGHGPSAADGAALDGAGGLTLADGVAVARQRQPGRAVEGRALRARWGRAPGRSIAIAWPPRATRASTIIQIADDAPAP